MRFVLGLCAIMLVLGIGGVQVDAIYEGIFNDILESLGFDVINSTEDDISENNSTITISCKNCTVLVKNDHNSTDPMSSKPASPIPSDPPNPMVAPPPPPSASMPPASPVAPPAPPPPAMPMPMPAAMGAAVPAAMGAMPAAMGAMPAAMAGT